MQFNSCGHDYAALEAIRRLEISRLPENIVWMVSKRNLASHLFVFQKGQQIMFSQNFQTSIFGTASVAGA